MKVSYKWLQQYVEIDVTPVELGERLTSAGLAVEHVELLGKDIKNVVVGEILETQKHPDADKLLVCQVDLGDEKVQIVTGASNIQTGDKVPIAKVGSELPGGMKLKKAKLRGLESFGMMCSAKELNIDETMIPEASRNGIYILDAACQPGEDVKKVLGLDDAVLEFELTPNRSDCLSVINIAREVGAVLGKKVDLPEIAYPESDEKADALAAVEVVDPDLCNRYVVKIVKNVKIAPSPGWMQHYLRCAGIRPISNVVDISNYVMLEMGQPLHTFDYDTLAGHKIIVRRALDDEKMKTLDDMERSFNHENLLICDGEKPVAVAGVMGGLSTEVTEQTKNILIEAARFHPVSIRYTSRDLGLRSEASLRFEKGLDVNNVAAAASRAAQLLVELAGGEAVSGKIDTYQEAAEQKQIKLRIKRVNEVLGTDLAAAEITEIMHKLDFTLEENSEGMLVTIPSYRQDISLEVDLIEEVARLIGYDRIPVTLPYGGTTEGSKTRAQSFQDSMKEFLTGKGFLEVINYSFINEADFDKINLPEDSALRRVVRIMNPLSDEQGVMRTTLLPGLLETAARNHSRRNIDLAIFEMGRIYLPREQKLPQEPLVLGGLISGKVEQGWKWQPQEFDFYYLKGILDALFARFGISSWTLETESLPPFLHPGRSANIYINGAYAGFMGEVHPLVQEKYDLESRACICQIFVEAILDAAVDVPKYVPVPRYPGMVRDMALLVKDELAAAVVTGVIKDNGSDILTGVTLFDVYRGSQIPEGFKSLAYTLTFQAPDRTLTDEEVNGVFSRIKEQLTEKLAVDLR